MTAPPLTWAAADDDLPRDPMARASLARRLAPWFGDLPGSSSPIRGGRQEAERRLAAIDPEAYGRNRNHLNGSVTGLSPYIRHGVLSLAEVREAVLSRLAVGDGAAALTPDEGPRAQPSDPPSATRTRRGGEGSPEPGRWHRPQGRPGGALIQQLAWRDYWQRAWLAWGEGVHLDREPLKTGLPSTAYAQGLPDDLAHGATGLACVDAFVADLLNRGWLHNHARLWLASYTVHWRRRRWQAGARWFHAHLLDADAASNSLSWQWVASSFSAKPYIFNRANLERFAGDSLCRQCPLASGGCPFDASYEALQERLFGAATPAAPGAVASGGPGEPSRGGTERHATESEPPREPATPGTGSLPAQPVLWIHAEDLSPRNAALLAHPHRPALFVFDPEAIEAEPWGLKRLLFLHDCLLELPVSLRVGDPLVELPAFVARCGADGVVTTRAVDPRLRRIMRRLSERLPLRVHEPAPLVPSQLPAGPGERAGARQRSLHPDLGRFSRYWRWAEPRLWGGVPGTLEASGPASPGRLEPAGDGSTR